MKLGFLIVSTAVMFSDFYKVIDKHCFYFASMSHDSRIKHFLFPIKLD